MGKRGEKGKKIYGEEKRMPANITHPQTRTSTHTRKQRMPARVDVTLVEHSWSHQYTMVMSGACEQGVIPKES